MPELQATLLAENDLFFWAPQHDVTAAVNAELPAIRALGTLETQTMVSPFPPHQRTPSSGYRVPLADAVPILSKIPHSACVSDSVRVLSRASQLALELAIHQRVVPTVDDTNARWRVLLTRSEDAERFDQLVHSLPTIFRAHPTQSRGPVRIPSAQTTVRRFLNATVDSLYRQNAYPASTRGWPLEFAESLRGSSSSFSPRDARYQGMPNRIREWASDSNSSGVRIGLRLSVPEASKNGFGLALRAHTTEPRSTKPLTAVWPSTVKRQRKTSTFAYALLRGLARASRIYPPLHATLDGAHPADLTWSAKQAYDFLMVGVPALRNAGFRIDLPSEFEANSNERLHARMCIDVGSDGDMPSLEDALGFRWEVVVGGHVIDGADFAALSRQNKPIVRFRDGWVLLDPHELAKLPENMTELGTLSSADALRAVLTGQHHGIPVVADQRLRVVLDTLRDPPDEPIPTGLIATLRPYQERGFSWLTTLGRLGLGACLADDMGLGKTIQLITHVLARRPQATGPCLVVCPTSVLGNWGSEFAKFAPELTIGRYHGVQRSLDDLADADVIVTTYGLMVRDIDALCEIQWDVVALDEAQSIKNPDSQRAKTARRLPSKHRVALSGTPVENRLLELWSIMEFLIPGLLGSRGAFRRNIAIPVERFGDEQAAEQLRQGVAPFILRRLKTDKDVISDLPEKLERRAWCSLSQEQTTLYGNIVEEYMERIQEAESNERRGNVLAMLTALKQVCNHPIQYTKEPGPLAGRSGKLDSATELLSQILENGERVLVFTQYRAMGDILQRHLDYTFGLSAPFLHGGTAAHHREELVRAFQEDEHSCPVLLISLRAGGTGLNLTNATNVLHYDRWWNPAVEDQATDRAYRIGQKRNVFVHKMVTAETLEQRIDALLDDKRALADSVVGAGDRWVTELDDDALRRLVMLGDESGDLA
jgi:hypothetical protein